MNIVKRELKAHLKSLLIWCGSMVFLIYAGMIKYSAFSETGHVITSYSIHYTKLYESLSRTAVFDACVSPDGKTEASAVVIPATLPNIIDTTSTRNNFV